MCVCARPHSQCLPCGAARFLPFCLDKHFLSVNTGESGTPQLPDEHAHTHTYTLFNINTIFALHAGSLSLTHTPPCMQITEGIIHTCSYTHTHAAAETHVSLHVLIHAIKQTHRLHPFLFLLLSPSLADHFSLPPSCSNTSFFFLFSHIFTHLHTHTS